MYNAKSIQRADMIGQKWALIEIFWILGYNTNIRLLSTKPLTFFLNVYPVALDISKNSLLILYTWSFNEIKWCLSEIVLPDRYLITVVSVRYFCHRWYFLDTFCCISQIAISDTCPGLQNKKKSIQYIST